MTKAEAEGEHCSGGERFSFGALCLSQRRATGGPRVDTAVASNGVRYHLRRPVWCLYRGYYWAPHLRSSHATRFCHSGLTWRDLGAIPGKSQSRQLRARATCRGVCILGSPSVVGVLRQHGAFKACVLDLSRSRWLSNNRLKQTCAREVGGGNRCGATRAALRPGR